MNYSSISQIALLVISVLIIFSYVQPTFGEIKQIQDEQFVYSDTLAKTNELNNELASLMAEARSYPQTSIASLEVYLPDEINALAVMADIERIATYSGIRVQDISADEVSEPNEDVRFESNNEGDALISQMITQDFNVTVVGSYENLKEMLRNLERNKYVLEVVTLQFGTVSDTASTKVTKSGVPDNGYTLTLRTYALPGAADLSSTDYVE